MLFDDSYFTLKSNATGEYRDRGSRFIGLAFPVTNEEDVKHILQQVKKDHPQANHHCYAFRISPDPTVFRASDDREPSGSAGKPILGAITSKGLTDVLVIVVRYFGGTLLGVPGLINAYRSAAAHCLEQASTIEKFIEEKFILEFPYDLSNEVHQLLRKHKADIHHQDYSSPCQIHFSLRKSAVVGFENAFKTHPVISYQTQLKHYEP